MSKTAAVSTDLFPTEPEGDLDLCNGQPGSAFARWLAEKLKAKGYDCEGEIQEDYGWGFWLKKAELPVWVSVSYAEPYQGSGPEWFVSSTFEIPFGFLNPRSWGKGKDGKLFESEIFAFIQEALENEPAIKILRFED